MENVNSFEYLEEVKNEMAWFDRTITLISQRYGKGSVLPRDQETFRTQEMASSSATTTSYFLASSELTFSEDRKNELLEKTEKLKKGLGFFPQTGTTSAPASTAQKASGIPAETTASKTSLQNLNSTMNKST